jgi:hypothetical protein
MNNGHILSAITGPHVGEYEKQAQEREKKAQEGARIIYSSPILRLLSDKGILPGESGAEKRRAIKQIARRDASASKYRGGLVFIEETLPDRGAARLSCRGARGPK